MRNGNAVVGGRAVWRRVRDPKARRPRGDLMASMRRRGDGVPELDGVEANVRPGDADAEDINPGADVSDVAAAMRALELPSAADARMLSSAAEVFYAWHYRPLMKTVSVAREHCADCRGIPLASSFRGTGPSP